MHVSPSSDATARDGRDCLGAALLARLETLAGFTDGGTALTRLYLSPAHRAAAGWLAGWMEQAGMTAHVDAAGNVVGRYEGATPGAPAVLLGSHIDSVRNAGKYDGTLGVVTAVAVVEELNRRGERLPFALEVIAFGDEEGVRFPVIFSGTRAVAGTFDPACLHAADADGVRLGEALAAFGGAPAALAADPATAARVARALAYLEVHIEQGPVLEQAGVPVGVVTAINGASRYTLGITGTAGHAGTVPMAGRRDALAAAADMVLAVERQALHTPGLVATVGRLDVLPGAVNVIAGGARLTLDVRSPDDRVRRDGAAAILDACAIIAQRRHVALSVDQTSETPAAPCTPALMDAFAAAAARAGVEPKRLPSGAGHDAMVFAGVLPMAMLFVRCRGGISHNPAESITAADAGLAAAVLLDTLRHLPVQALS
ncbi:allantoate deiminase [Azospirillum fermentarium]|uniref:allantoate amidohydrolase n=1 Tax=Azospirillum fermentarium TaxID=1233114 RepID=UPI00222605BE|nr:allantoate amidohydrolase [Azospirillum fermentarium]MCW2244536.1 allantoate deiminase [Azospirillum fermentarium]